MFGSKFLGGKIWGANSLGWKLGEQDGEQIFFERNFLGRKFWGACFGGADSFGGEILPAKFLENFLRVKSHLGEEKNTGKQKCFGGKIWGAKNIESKFLSLMVSP